MANADFLPEGYRLIDVVPMGGGLGAYTFAAPPALGDRVVPGARVVVPFGGRRRTGIVLGPAAAFPDDVERTTREIESVPDEPPMLTAEILKLATWAADYYAAALSFAFRAALPPGAETEESFRALLSDAGRHALATGSAKTTTRKALRVVESGESQVLAPGAVKRLEREGYITLERTVTVGEAPTIEMVSRRADVTPVIGVRHHAQRAVWEALANGPLSFAELRHAAPTARVAVDRLAKLNLVSIDRVPRTAEFAAAPQTSGPPLNEEQAAALAVLEAGLDESNPTPFLLEGVTGSGKTEVYLQLISAARKRGRNALALVPEIALTPQLATRFRSRFGAQVAVLHSGLTDRDRAMEWHRIRRGEASIVVGARSAVFAPLDRPAVVVVDEEHDASYKQAEGLRYQGRDLAVVRGRYSNAVVVLGSATPSLETVFNAQRGRYRHVRLRNRIDARPMPAVEVVDLRGRVRMRPDSAVQPSDLLSTEVVQALKEIVARKEQAIVFLNRRGHSTALLCRDCGTVMRCSQCSVAMTWHERRKRLVCHYCGAREGAPDQCPNCGSVRLLFSGAGTQKLEDELALAVPGARISRLDRDTASTARRLEQMLAKFSAREIDILIGTQMVAKGHDFPGVTLVCALLADGGLHQPDFRAGERTAQLLQQVAGRAGRGDLPGRVILQTFVPEMPVVRSAITHDYRTFAEAELLERQSAAYPPFRRLCLLRIEGADVAEASSFAARTAAALRAGADPNLSVLGPAPAPLSRLRGRYRFHVLLKAQRHDTLIDAVRKLREAVPKPPAGIRVAVDVDPVDMM